MKKIILITIFTLCSVIVQAQLSLYANVSTSDHIGLLNNPYDNPDPFFDETSFFGGFEVGYRFSKRFEARVFFASGEMDKGSFFENSAYSKIEQFGIKPQINVYTFKKDIFHLDVAMPLSRIQEEVLWRDNVAEGKDNAEFFRVGLAPTFRIQLENPRIIIEVSANFNFENLTDMERELYGDSPETYRNPENDFHQTSSSLNLSVGYSFW